MRPSAVCHAWARRMPAQSIPPASRRCVPHVISRPSSTNVTESDVKSIRTGAISAENRCSVMKLSTVRKAPPNVFLFTGSKMISKVASAFGNVSIARVTRNRISESLPPPMSRYAEMPMSASKGCWVNRVSRRNWTMPSIRNANHSGEQRYERMPKERCRRLMGSSPCAMSSQLCWKLPRHQRRSRLAQSIIVGGRFSKEPPRV